MKPFTKFILWMAFISSLILCGMIWVAKDAHAWSVKEAHNLGNETLVRVGNWCSGTVIDKERGLVVTAAHCVNTPNMLTVINTKKETHDGKLVNVAITVWLPVDLTIDTFTDEGLLFKRAIYKAVYVGQDAPHDVAILRIISSTKGLMAEAKMSRKLSTWGDVIYCIGNPLMLPAVVTKGLVIQPRVKNPLGEGFMILFDAMIDHGSSGGGIYNDAGEMIGITNLVGPKGEGLANPVAHVFALLTALKLGKEHRVVAQN